MPGQLPMPSPYSDLSSIYPNLSQTNAAVSSDIMSKLRGELSPNTVSQIQDAAAEFGVGSGMPGSGLQWNKALRDIGMTSEQQQQQGLQAYGSLIPAISGTQTVNPALQTEVNLQNSLNAAAPDPAAAASYAQELFDKYLQALSGPAGASGSYSPGGNRTETWHAPGAAGGGPGSVWYRSG